jgi:multiple PDZ domain protein
MFVNDCPLEHASLDTAVQALKGAPQGMVRIGVAKPLPVPDTSQLTTSSEKEEDNSAAGEEEEGDNTEEDNTEVRSTISDMDTDPEAPRPAVAVTTPVKKFSGGRSDSISSDIPDLPPPLPTSPLPDEEDGMPLAAAAALPPPAGMAMPATERLIGGTKKKVAPAPPSFTKTVETRYEERRLIDTVATTDADNIPALPTALEQRVRIVKDADTLGLQVDIEEGGVNGLVVRSLTRGGTLARDGRVQPGDYLVNVNGENLRGVSQAAALAVLRRTQLVPLGT